MSKLNRQSFAQRFASICRHHNAFAAFVVFEMDEVNPQAVRLFTGGEKKANMLLDLALEAGKFAIGNTDESRPVMEYEQRLDVLISSAFPADHPAMLDYAFMKFEMKRLRRDSERLNWLEHFNVEARQPLAHGSALLFQANPEPVEGLEDKPSNIRLQIDYQQNGGLKPE